MGWQVLLAVLDGANNVVVSFLRGLDLSGTMQGAGGVGGLLAVRLKDNGTHFAAFDGNGNVTALVSAADGTESARYEYGPFAESLRMTGPAAKLNPIRFSTQYADDVTGDVKYLFRDYDASTGRWLNRDPIGEVGGLNLYAFVANSPISHYDPVGLFLFGCSRDPCSDPCGDAKRKGLDNGDVAGVVCCGGKKYTCVWISGGATGAGNKKAKKIIDKCSGKHEDTHHDDIDCPSGPGITRPPFKPGKDPNTEECSAYKTDVACLKSSIGDCNGDPQCIAQVQAEINSDNQQIKKLCGP